MKRKHSDHSKKKQLSKKSPKHVVEECDKHDEDYDNGSESDTASDISINAGVRNVEVENSDMLHTFQNCYRYFKDNKDNRSGGYIQFPNHLLAYLFHRSLFHKRGRYNPTNKCDTDLFK